MNDKKARKKKVPYSIMLEAEDLQLLKERAADMGMPPAILARNIISEGLYDCEKPEGTGKKHSKVRT